MRRKGDLPSKPCAVCGRPFTWRKKWADVWDDVKYCSDACRRQRRPSAQEDPADLTAFRSWVIRTGARRDDQPFELAGRFSRYRNTHGA